MSKENLEKTVKVYGYSERGIFNSIIYYLDSKQQEQPELIGKFLNELGVEGYIGGYHFTFLNEQSFSDFGDSDLTIIAEQIQTKKKTVIFIEGKVKTYDGKYDLETEFEKINKDELYAKDVEKRPNGFSSNIFIQLYYKYLLQRVINSKVSVTENMNTKTADLDLNEIFMRKNNKGKPVVNRSIGKNGIVIKACKEIKNAEYFYVALLPKKEIREKLRDKYNEIKPKLTTQMETKNVICAYWGDIEDFFIRKNAKEVNENFTYNEGQIYNKCKQNKN